VTDRVASLRELLRLAEAAGVPARVLKAAGAEIAALLDQPPADRRRAATFERARAIRHCIDQGLDRAATCLRLGISTDAYHRALRALRDSRYSAAVQAEETQEELTR
jgi:hypothetical protein